MARPALLETIQRMAIPLAAAHGLELWGIELLQSSRPVARIYVDVPHGQRHTEAQDTVQENAQESGLCRVPEGNSATVDQCAEISRQLGLSMEVDNVFASAYVLEVSSPGLSRPFFQLEQMAAYVGDTVEATLLDALPEHPGRKKFRGRLLSVGEHDFRLTLEGEAGEELCVDWEKVRKASRVHVFVDPVKPGKRKDAK